MKPFQITCRCTSYKFPHRLGGGKCTGDNWAEQYYIFNKSECTYCNANGPEGCEVATAQETIKECEAYELAMKNETEPRVEMFNFQHDQLHYDEAEH